jgi:hypothetical protein
VLPSLSLDAPLGASWSLHLGGAGSTLGTPGAGIARASLGEAALAFTDRRRLRAELIAYSEGDAALGGVNRGFAAAVGWEIAPRVSLRAWSLRDVDRFDTPAPVTPPPPLYPPVYPGGATPVTARTVATLERFDRDVVWLTWDAPTRLDVLLRGGAIEGSVRIPLGSRYALSLGSYRRPDRRSALSMGLAVR